MGSRGLPSLRGRKRTMGNSRRLFVRTFPILALLALAWTSSCDDDSGGASPGGSNAFDQAIAAHKDFLFEEGRRIFRFDTFGDEAWWGDQLRLHEAILGADLGGVGPGVSPETALAVGLKVDLDALPPELVN